MANRFSVLRQKMSPEAQVRAGVKAQAMLAEMPLNELRQARGLSQKMLADLLHVQQPAIAKMEKRTDMYLSTLRSHSQHVVDVDHQLLDVVLLQAECLEEGFLFRGHRSL